MMVSRKSGGSKRLFIALWLACIVGSWAVIPYVQHLGILPPSISILKYFFLTTIQSALVFGLACWLSYLLVPKTDLSPFVTEQPLKRILYPGVLSGVLVGLIIHFLDSGICELLASKGASFRLRQQQLPLPFFFDASLLCARGRVHALSS